MSKWIEMAHEKRAHIFPSALYWAGAQQAARRAKGPDIRMACWYVEHEFSHLTVPHGVSVAGRTVLKKLKKDDQLLDKIVENNKKEIPKMVGLARELSGQQLSKFSGKELNRRWQRWLASWIRLMEYSTMGTILEMHEPLLSSELVSILESKLGKGHPRVGEYFQILTTAKEKTVSGKEEIDLLKLRLKQLDNTATEKDIAGHAKKYSFIAFGYDGPGWNASDISNRLKDLPKQKVKVKVLLDEKEKAGREIVKKQNKAVKELNLTGSEERLFFILRTLGFWKFERKFHNQKAHELMEDFIKEIARRNSLSIAQAKMIAPDEVEDVLIKNKVRPDILNERIKEALVFFEKGSYKTLSGQKLKSISKEIRKSLEVDKSLTELTGTTAYSGKARGQVRRIDAPEDMINFKKGDILISASTSPHILPAMKKAGAVVTDSGGITSHAAIVAREIKVPTLIGTKVASKILKDGDRVEVDAGKGIIKKL